MKIEPDNLCVFDIDYISNRNRVEFSSQHNHVEHPSKEKKCNHSNKSYGRHPLLDTALFNSENIGLGHWINDSFDHWRYGWGCTCCYEKTEEEKIQEKNTIHKRLMMPDKCTICVWAWGNGKKEWCKLNFDPDECEGPDDTK